MADPAWKENFVQKKGAIHLFHQIIEINSSHLTSNLSFQSLTLLFEVLIDLLSSFEDLIEGFSQETNAKILQKLLDIVMANLDYNIAQQAKRGFSFEELHFEKR